MKLFLTILVIHHRIFRTYHFLGVSDSGKDDRHERFRLLFHDLGDTPH